MEEKTLVSRLNAQGLDLDSHTVVALDSGWLSQMRIPVTAQDEKFSQLVSKIFFVREPWFQFSKNEVWFKADEELKGLDFNLDQGLPLSFNHSRHMPEEAARYFLVVERVEQQQLQDISEKDIYEELTGYGKVHKSILRQLSPREAFALRWNKALGIKDGPCSWQDNPVVWVLHFRVVTAAEAEDLLRHRY